MSVLLSHTAFKSRSQSSGSRRVLKVAVATGALAVVTALPAAAHVTVSSPDAAPGGFGKLVFRVPTESDTASTTEVKVGLPSRTPFAFVSTKPHAGWTVTSTERKLAHPLTTEGATLTRAVSVVTWTAQRGQGIKPGQFDEFELSVGPFPTQAVSLALPVQQTYSDGTVVRWSQLAKSGEPEPEHPAPTLTVTESSDQVAAEALTAPTSSAAAPSGVSSDTSDALARWIGVTGLAVAAGAVIVAAIGGRRRRA
jgi:uncharacterized protein YcnI